MQNGCGPKPSTSWLRSARACPATLAPGRLKRLSSAWCATPRACRRSHTNSDMTLQPGEEVELSIEKPAAGGRMIARHDRQIVLVSGSIPGERVLVRIQ